MIYKAPKSQKESGRNMIIVRQQTLYESYRFEIVLKLLDTVATSDLGADEFHLMHVSHEQY